MRKHFFTARNIADYKKFFSAAVSADKLHGDTEQTILHAYIKHLFKIDDAVLDSELACATDIDGLRLDFNCGLRLDLPAGNFRVVISDADTEEIFFDRHISDGRLISAEQHFIRWRVEIFSGASKIFSHTLNLAGQPVAISFRLCDMMGDTLALLPSVREFVRRHRCRPTLILPEYLRELAANFFPDLPQADTIPVDTYATYFPTMVRGSSPAAPVDIRNMPMKRVGGAIFNLPSLPPSPTFTPTMPRICSEPYVCIAVQASTPTKGWLYPHGWDIVVDYLKRLGYRVFCIDKHAEETAGDVTIRTPAAAENFTGDLPIMHRANMLSRAEFFVGLSSGLAWLADAVSCPVVMICGFSQDWFEFYTPYRVANRLVCNGCLNDVRVDFIKDVCPHHRDTPRELECQKKISPRQVLDAVERLIVEHNLTPPVMR